MSTQSGPETAPPAGRPNGDRRLLSQRVDVDHGQRVGQRLKDCPVVMSLRKLFTVGRRTTGRRDG